MGNEVPLSSDLRKVTGGLCRGCNSCFENITMRWWVQESWYEKLNRWEEALKAYDAKREESQPGSPQHLEASMGRLR